MKKGPWFGEKCKKSVCCIVLFTILLSPPVKINLYKLYIYRSLQVEIFGLAVFFVV